MCGKHYYRMYRGGTTEKKQRGSFFLASGYLMLTGKKGHKLADSRGQVLAHRHAFYESNGEGPFECEWCGVSLTWIDLHVDHLDEDRSNNDPVNLKPSCCSCNTNRKAGQKKKGRDRNKSLLYQGKSYTLKELSELAGISVEAMRQRVRYMSVEHAVETPKGRWSDEARNVRSTGVRLE